MAKKRTEMRSKAGKKLYAIHDEQGEFVDIETSQPCRRHAFSQQGGIGKESQKEGCWQAGQEKSCQKGRKKKSTKRTK